MSSSPAPALKKDVEAQPFPYADAIVIAAVQASTQAVSIPVDVAEQRHEQKIQEARQEGEIRARQAYEIELEHARGSLRTALLKFEKDRMAYFQKVETEVVQLALSIARKVLHRESQVDPLLLAGIVRVSLDKIESKTKIIVRVHPLYAADCRAFFAHGMEPHAIPEVHEDPTVEPEQCVLETELGTTELGIEVQLKEIEKGLMDLLAARPPVEQS